MSSIRAEVLRSARPFESRAKPPLCSPRKVLDFVLLLLLAGAGLHTIFLATARFIPSSRDGGAVRRLGGSGGGSGGGASASAGGAGASGSARAAGAAPAAPAAAGAPASASIARSVAARAPLGPRARPAIAAEHSDFCTPPSPPELSDEASDAVARGAWDAVGQWPAARAVSLLANATCFLAALAHNELRFRPVHICTHDPSRDQVMAESFHKWKWWGANNDHRFVLAAGHAGTPLTAVDAARMRFAAQATGFALSTAALVDVLRLDEREPPDDEKAPHAACSRERPFVLDVGGNIGYYTLVAAAGGCSVVAVEPLTANVGRLYASILSNGFSDHVTLFKNAVGKDARLVTLDMNAGNPGASSVSDGGADADALGVRGGDGRGGGDGVRETVATVYLDDLFDGGAERPRHPFSGLPISPRDVAMIKVDVEGFDAAALWALRGMIEVGRPPLIKIEYEAPRVRGTSGCDNVGLMRWLYGLGYAAYGFGHGHPLTLSEWEEKIIPLLLEGKGDELTKDHKLPVLRELYLVHKDAPVPSVMESDGPGGRAPV